MIATPHPPAEVLRPLSVGTIVRLPDDTIAEVTSSTLTTVSVVHGYLLVAGISGAGSCFQRWEVEEATACEQDCYRAALRLSRQNVLTGLVVVIWAPQAVRS